MYTQKVDMTTEMSGAMAETQKSFLFFLAWIIPMEQHDRQKKVEESQDEILSN